MEIADLHSAAVQAAAADLGADGTRTEGCRLATVFHARAAAGRKLDDGLKS